MCATHAWPDSGCGFRKLNQRECKLDLSQIGGALGMVLQRLHCGSLCKRYTSKTQYVLAQARQVHHRPEVVLVLLYPGIARSAYVTCIDCRPFVRLQCSPS